MYKFDLTFNTPSPDLQALTICNEKTTYDYIIGWYDYEDKGVIFDENKTNENESISPNRSNENADQVVYAVKADDSVKEILNEISFKNELVDLKIEAQENTCDFCNSENGSTSNHINQVIDSIILSTWKSWWLCWSNIGMYAYSTVNLNK